MDSSLLLQTLQWRYAAKQFDSTRQIEPSLLQTLQESMVLTPSSYGLQPWKFLFIQDPQIRQKLVPHCYGQAQIADCSCLVVLCARNAVTDKDIQAHLDQVAQTSQIERSSLASFEELLQKNLRDGLSAEQQQQWAKDQVYIALGQLLLSAALLKIDTCPMEGFLPAKVDQTLELENSGYHSVLLCPLGYRNAEDPQAKRPKVRFPSTQIIADL